MRVKRVVVFKLSVSTVAQTDVIFIYKHILADSIQFRIILTTIYINIWNFQLIKSTNTHTHNTLTYAYTYI